MKPSRIPQAEMISHPLTAVMASAICAGLMSVSTQAEHLRDAGAHVSGSQGLAPGPSMLCTYWHLDLFGFWLSLMPVVLSFASFLMLTFFFFFLIVTIPSIMGKYGMTKGSPSRLHGFHRLPWLWFMFSCSITCLIVFG